MTAAERLKTITELSHEFGTAQYVQGGGGNTSCKDDTTLWVKPSGTTLLRIQPEEFVALDRAKLRELFDAEVSRESSEREQQVKELMMRAVRPDSSGRPSVEAPLHESFEAVYVVHVHPALVNGMTCAQEGAAACARLFPDALWMDYTDPGYTLCIASRDAMNGYRKEHGHEPELVFMQNHGVFVAGDSPEDIREAYLRVMNTLKKAVAEAGVSMELETGPQPVPEAVDEMTRRLQELLGPEHAAVVRAGGSFIVPEGPLSPDHIVYSKSYHLVGEPTEEAVAAFREQHGYLPLVISCESGVYAVGKDEKTADLALTLSRDGALVAQLTEAFGGPRYMDKRASDFIENWEVESYRRQVAS